MSPSLIVFPGQGSQFVGMGKKLLHLNKVTRMFELASDKLKLDLLSVCLNGPKAQLDKTIYSQMGVFVSCLAAVEYLKETNPNAVQDCYATAGFGVGEYASLVLSGALSYEDALSVLKARTEAMQKSSEQIPSGLMSVFVGRQSKLNLAMLAARKWCKEKLKLNEPIECQIANYINSGLRVIGGNKEALDFIELNTQEFNLIKIKRLAVSGAFHTSLMKPAGDSIKSILKEIEIKQPLIKFYSNYDAKPHSRPEKIKQILIKQVSNPVKWEQTLNEFYYNENLPIELDQPNETDESKSESKSESSEDSAKKTQHKKHLQLKDRIYPDIYECGPADHTGNILRLINHKAFRFYKHISV